MIKKITFGNPFNTESIVCTDNISKCNEIPFFTVTEINDSTLSFTLKVSQDAIMYGLGESNRGINKRGYIYESNCADDPNHTEDKISLYGAHNFLIIDDGNPFGIFIDTPGVVRFDLCYEAYDTVTITTGKDVDIYIIENALYKDIVHEFRILTGSSYIPPLWAFGYQQCRWSYLTASEIKEVVAKHRENDIPLDAVYMDIDYMERYKDFTINDETFPDFDNFVKEMKDENIHLVPIIDAGVKIEDGYDVYEEGVKNNYFCKTADNKDYVAAVWPGYTHFPDFIQPEVRKWFGDKYSFLIDKGIDGFWNDMNEPAIFHTPYGIERAVEKLKAIDINAINCYDNDTLKPLFDLREELGQLQNNQKDYGAMYHNYNGTMINHKDIHNIYGYNMTRAAGEAIKENYPDKRILLFSRSSYIGMHRYGGIWTGDNQSWWSHLLLNIKMMPSLNMCGFMYSGADLGGFGSNTTRDLVLRWLAFSLFTPLMRNHSALGTRYQEFYRFENPSDFRDVINVRYALIPYLYSEYVKAALKDEMFIKPLSFDFQDDEMARNVEDQLMIGDSIMATPVYTQNAKGRYVYLPEDMMYVKFKGWEEKEYCIMPKGHHYIEVALNEVPLFIRKNHILPLVAPAQSTADINTSTLDLFCYLDKDANEASYVLYEDDGYSPCKDIDGNSTTITISRNDAPAIMVDTKGKSSKKINLTIL